MVGNAVDYCITAAPNCSINNKQGMRITIRIN
jgi:hypothetical protein